MEEFETQAEKLQRELEVRAKYYFKGFGAMLQGVFAHLDNFIVKGATLDREKSIRDGLGKMVSLYESIPFGNITNHPDYSLLLEIREAIQKLVPEVEQILHGGKSIKEAHEIVKIIMDKGSEYREHFAGTIKQLQAQPGHEDDGVRLVDTQGKVWENYNKPF